MFRKIIIFLSLFSSCQEKETISQATKTEKINFSINDSLFSLDNNFKATFYINNDSIVAATKGDSLVYNKFSDVKSKDTKVRFVFNNYNLEFDSIPINLLTQDQHTRLEFGITSKSMFISKNLENDSSKYKGLKYQFFTINPWDSGVGRYFEKPYR